jgi:hypothetical protein
MHGRKYGSARSAKALGPSAHSNHLSAFPANRLREIAGRKERGRLLAAGSERDKRSADINRLDDFEFFPQRIDFETHHLGHQAVAEFIGPSPAILGDRRPGREGFLIDHQGFASQARAGDVAGDDIHGGFNPSSSSPGSSRERRNARI